MFSFVLGPKELTKGFMVMHSIYYDYGSSQTNGVIHGEKLTGVGSDRTIEMTLFQIYPCLVG